MNVFGVVVAFDNADLTIAAVESILLSTEPVRLVVWDNASTDGTVHRLAETFGDRIIIHPSEENIYWSPALVQAVERYWDGEDYLAFFNNDLVVHPDSIQRMMKVAERSNRIGVVVPTGSSMGGLQDFAHYHARNLPKPGDRDIFNVNAAIASWEPERIDSYIGAMTLMPKSAWDEVGGLDPNVPMADDIEYAIRLKQFGYEIWLAKNVYVEHVGRASGDDSSWRPLIEASWRAISDRHPGWNQAPHEPMRLNLGCGDQRMDGYVGVDITEGPATDVVSDIRSLPYPDGTADEIYSAQVIEHFFPSDTQDLFREWLRVLRPGGTMHVTTPDFEHVAHQYIAGGMGIGLVRAYVCGTVDDLNTYDPDVPESYHRTVWDADSLRYELSAVGFKHIETWSDQWVLHATARKPPS